MILKLDMQHQGLKLYKVYINDDHGLTLFNGENLHQRTKLTELFCL